MSTANETEELPPESTVITQQPQSISPNPVIPAIRSNVTNNPQKANQKQNSQGGTPSPQTSYTQQPIMWPHSRGQMQRVGMEMETYRPQFRGMQPNGNPMAMPGMYGAPPMAPPVLLPGPPVEGCPPGLEFLIDTDYLFVKQELEMMEILMQIETPNRYNIMNANGQRIYYAAEIRDLCSLQCSGGNLRSFHIPVYDFTGRQVLCFDRKFSCQLCLLTDCFNCFGSTGAVVDVTLEDGTLLLGQIKQVFNGCQPLFYLNDSEGKLMVLIKGPSGGEGCCSCMGQCGTQVVFEVALPNGSVVGQITRHAVDFILQSISDADTFGVNFPIDLDVRSKCLLLGAVFLLDFMYFETTPNQQPRYHRGLYY